MMLGGYYGYWVVLVCTSFYRKAEREYMNDIVRVLYTIGLKCGTDNFYLL
jgi:hypothetical protein